MITKLAVLEDALSGRAWAFSGLLHGIPDALDTEGRPLGERRATSATKDGVEIELRACPYNDGRRGQPMNLSAFKQVMEHFDAVVEDITRFQRALSRVHEGRWRFLVAVADQLARPAAFLVQTADPSARVPAQMAVGHKLAAGFFGAVNVQRPDLPAGSPAEQARHLMDEVHERELLFGASEVCAGPLNLIERAAVALVDPGDGEAPEPSPRVRRALLLAAQLRVGRSLAAADHALERWLLDAAASGELRPRNDYMTRAIEARRSELADRPASIEVGPLVPAGFRADLLDPLRATDERVAAERLGPMIGEALGYPEDAALHPSDALREAVVARIVGHLDRRRAAIGAQWRLEMALRETFERSLGDALRLNALLAPRVGAGRWIDAILGHRVEMSVSDDPSITLRNHKRSLTPAA